MIYSHFPPDEPTPPNQSDIPKRSLKLVLELFTISVAVLVLLSFGFIGGRYAVIAPISKQLSSLQKKRTLGQHLSEKEKQEVILAYYPENQNINDLDNYSWMPLCLVTPFLGDAPAPGQQNNAHINSRQFRSPKEIVIPKPKGLFRIFLTGGSTAYGSGAPSDDRTIAGYLESKLNANLSSYLGKSIEVFTLASPAWTSTHERIAIENILSELQPDLVISFSGNNDVHWAETGNDIFQFRTYFDKNIFNIIKFIYAQSQKTQLTDNITVLPKPITPETVVTRLIKNIELSATTLEAINTPYIFVLQPTLASVSKTLTDREKSIIEKRNAEIHGHKQYFEYCYKSIDKKIISIVGDKKFNKLYYQNLSNVFDSYTDEEIFIDSYHFGDRGNEAIANAILKKITMITTN